MEVILRSSQFCGKLSRINVGMELSHWTQHYHLEKPQSSSWIKLLPKVFAMQWWFLWFSELLPHCQGVAGFTAWKAHCIPSSWTHPCWPWKRHLTVSAEGKYWDAAPEPNVSSLEKNPERERREMFQHSFKSVCLHITQNVKKKKKDKKELTTPLTSQNLSFVKNPHQSNLNNTTPNVILWLYFHFWHHLIY